MNFCFWKSGDTKKEELPQDDKTRSKYKKLLSKYKECKSNLDIMNETALELLREQDAMRLLLFAMVIQHGGKLEITSDTLKITESTQNQYDLDFKNNDGNLVYVLKRKEPTA